MEVRTDPPKKKSFEEFTKEATGSAQAPPASQAAPTSAAPTSFDDFVKQVDPPKSVAPSPASGPQGSALEPAMSSGTSAAISPPTLVEDTRPPADQPIDFSKLGKFQGYRPDEYFNPLEKKKLAEFKYDKPKVFAQPEGAAAFLPDGTQIDIREARIEEDWNDRVKEFVPSQYTPYREAAMKEAGTWTQADELRKGREKRVFQANVLRKRSDEVQRKMEILRDQGWGDKEQQLADMELQLRTLREQSESGQSIGPNMGLELRAMTAGSMADPQQYNQLVEKFNQDLQAYNAVMKPLLDDQQDISKGFEYLQGREEEAIKTYEQSFEVRDKKAHQGVIDQRYQDINERWDKGDLHWYSPEVLESHVVQPVTSTTSRFLLDAAGALGRTVDQYGNIPNKLAGEEDYYSPFAEAADNLTSISEEITRLPSELSNPIIQKDWSINTESLVPKLLQAATYMTLLGASGRAGGNTGLTAAAYASTEEDYYREAISSGMTPGQAQAFSMPAALTQALLERVSPGPLMSGRTVKDVMMARAMQAIKTGAEPRAAIADAAKYTLTEMGREFAQEGLQGLADIQVKGTANFLLGDEKLDASFNAQELTEQALMGAAMGFLASSPGAAKRLLQRPMTAQTLDWAARNSDKVRAFIEENGGNDKAQLLERLDDIDKMYTGNRLKEVKPEVATVVAPKIAEVQDIDSQVKESPMDPVIEAAVGDPRADRKEELTREILTDMGVTDEAQEEALVEAKIIPPPLDEEGKAVKPKAKRRKAKAIADEVAEPPKEEVTEKKEEGPLLVEEATQQTAETEPVSSPAVNEDTNGTTTETPAPIEEAAPVQDIPVQAAAAEAPGFKRTDFQPVTELTQLAETKDKKHISFAIPGFEEYSITVSKVPGSGWKAIKATTHAEITPQGHPTPRLAAFDASERMERAGKEKLDRVISSLHASAQAQRVQETSGTEGNTDPASPAARTTERIPVSPAEGNVRDRREVLRDLSRGVKRSIRYQKPGRRNATGTYSPASAAVKIRYAGDLDVTAHEIGHALDDTFGIVQKGMDDLGSMAELMELSVHGSTPPRGHPNPSLYRAGEGMAEYIRARVVNPDEAAAKYPELTAIYDETVSADAKKAIESFSNDVRAFAGATGAEMVMSNVDFDPKKSDSVLKDLFKKEEGFNVTFADKMRANWVNPLRAFQKAISYAQDIQGQEELRPSKDPYLLARLLLHINGKTSEGLSSGVFNSRNEVIRDESGQPKNLEWILAPLDSSTEESVTKDAKDVAAYMIAERTVELAGRFDRESVLTGIGGGIFSDVDVAAKALTEFFKDPARLARLQEGASRYRQVAHHILEYLRDKGRLSQEQFDLITENNLQYVALQRVLETAPGEEVQVFKGNSSKIGSSSSPIKSIHGSSRTILNPYVALMDSFHKSIKEADRNEVMMAFTDLLRSDRQMYEGEPMPLSDVGNIGKQGDKNSITVFNNGKAEHWVFQADIYKALKGLDEEGYKIPGIFRAPASVLRWTVTHFPVFAMRNIVRDLQARLILSDSYSAKDHAALRPLRDLMGDKKHWAEVARAGGLNAGYYLHDAVHYNGLLKEAMNKIAKNKKFILADPRHLHRVWGAYTDLLYKSEGVNRVAQYRASFREAKRKEMNDYDAQLYAAFRSSDLIDFALGGHHARVVNQLIPFFNAMVQGLRSAVVHGHRDPVGLTARIALYGIIPSVAVWLLAHQDDDEAKEYEELPAYQRDMFFNFKIGPDKWVSIPKPFELSLPGAAAERLLSQQLAGNENAWDGYAGSVAKSFLPDEAALAGPGKVAVELIANYDFFRDKTIVPTEDEKKALDLLMKEGKTESASRVAQVMQGVVGMDARKWDHLIETQFSYFGKTALKLSDIGKEDSRHQFDLSDIGFFRGSPAYNSAIATKITKLAQEYGLTSEKAYKRFRRAADRYFSATTAEERDQRAEELRTIAENLMPIIEKHAERALKKAEHGRK